MDLVDARAVAARLENRKLAVGQRLQDGRAREAVGPRLVERQEDVVRDTRADHREERRRGHRQAEAQGRLVRLLERRSLVECLHQDRRLARQHPVDHEAGRVPDHDAALP